MQDLLYLFGEVNEVGKMLSIAICDTKYENRRRTADILTKILFDETEIQFVFYETGIQIMEDILHQRFLSDLLFIDVILPGVDGMRVVDFMRKQNCKTDVIFLTDAAEWAAEGYQYHAFDYLIKPVAPKRFEKTLKRYVEEKLYTPEDFLSVSIRGCSQKIQLNRVLFFESRERKISAVMVDEEITFYQKMGWLETNLKADSFIRCHQSYMVNAAYIFSLTASEIILMNKKKIPVSKRYSRAVRDFVLNLS